MLSTTSRAWSTTTDGALPDDAPGRTHPAAEGAPTPDLPSPRTGVITHTDFLEPVARHPQVIHVKPKVKVGEKVTGPDTGVPDWLGEIMVQGPTVEAASQVMDEILNRLEYPIQPLGA